MRRQPIFEREMAWRRSSRNGYCELGYLQKLVNAVTNVRTRVRPTVWDQPNLGTWEGNREFFGKICLKTQLRVGIIS